MEAFLMQLGMQSGFRALGKTCLLDQVFGSGDTLTDEVEKVLQDKRPSQLEEPFHDSNDYNASLSQVWQ